MKIVHWMLLSTSIPFCIQTVHAFDPAPLLGDTTGVMKLMDIRDGKRFIYARIEDTKDYFRADIDGREIRDEGNGKYRFEMIRPSKHSESNPFWLRVSSSGVFIESGFDLAFGGKVPFLLIPLNGQTRVERRTKSDSGEDVSIETIVGATETIKTPSGEYVALKVEYGVTSEDGCMACESFWFSPGVGLIAYSETSGGAQHFLIANGGKDLPLTSRKYEASLERFIKGFKRMVK